MNPTTPGWKTSEGWLTGFKALSGTAALFLSMFGGVLPDTLQPGGPWVGVAAFIASTVAVAVYGKNRTDLHKTVTTLDAATVPPQPVSDTVAVTVPTGDGGYGLIEICFAVLLLVIALVVLFHFVH